MKKHYIYSNLAHQQKVSTDKRIELNQKRMIRRKRHQRLFRIIHAEVDPIIKFRNKLLNSPSTLHNLFFPLGL